MHHFRGKLRDGERTRLETANVYIDYDPGEPGAGWHGYLLVPSDGDVEPGRTYTLTLADGRSGALTVDGVTPDDSGKFHATFVGDGPLK